ncbi:hypothetical protein AB2N08_07735 [Massilia aurea]|uniref:hypothetical protein n=1 Tax=Massilia aurea TaxID=373040 RepID=UPI003462336F
MQIAVSYDDPASRQRSNRRVIVGVVVSLAVHALLLLAYRNSNTNTLEAALTEPMSILVTIAPPAPPPEQRVEPVTPRAPAASRTARRAPPTAVIAVPDTPAAAPEAFVVQQSETPAAPAFDMDAARQVARANANLRDPAKAGTALAQFPEPALQTETPLARSIAGAKRRDCKDGVPGGLLAPIFLLMDKKDSGCKW